MATLVTVADAAARTGKSERSIWRYAQRLEDSGTTAVYRIPGLQKSLVDFDVIQRVALKQRRGNPRHREVRESRNL